MLHARHPRVNLTVQMPDPAHEHDAFEHHDQGVVIALATDLPSGDALRTALTATGALVEPLAIEARFACLEHGLPVDPTHPGDGVLLVADTRGVEVSRTYVGTLQFGADRLDPDVVIAWLGAAAHRCTAQAHAPTWVELDLVAGAARVFDPDLARRAVLRVRAAERPGNVHAIAVTHTHGLATVRAPTAAMRAACMSAPVRVGLRDVGRIEIALELRWSAWTRPGAAERGAVDDAVAWLVTRGWSVEHDGRQARVDSSAAGVR